MNVIESIRHLPIKWKLMLPVIIVMLGIGIANSAWVGMKVRELAVEQSKRDLLNLSEPVFGAMTEYMNTDMMEARKQSFLDHMNKMLPVRMVRGEALDAQYGKKSPDDYPRDDAEREVFRTGRPAYSIVRLADGEEYLRGIFPYINVSDYMGTNCLGCHSVGAGEGDVLGAVSIGVSMKKTRESVTRTRGIIALITALLSLGSIGIIFYTVKKVLISPLDGITRVVRHSACKDFRSRLDVRCRDDIGRISESINQMAAGLGTAISGVAEVTRNLTSDADRLKEAVDETLEGTGRQAMQASQIAGAAEEMSQTVVGIAQSSSTASASAHEAMQDAMKGKDVVTQSVVKINSAGEAARELAEMIKTMNGRIIEIGDITRVINEIADQTNLLALNAAIEAARAGEQGRGFAVVAEEVRKLASKTMKATREIDEKIKGVQDDSSRTALSMDAALGHVTDSVVFMTTANESLDRIVSSVQKTADEISQIAASIEQQTATSEDIARNIDDISQIARQTQQSTEKLKVVFDGLKNHSQMLDTTVNEFKV